MGNVNVINKKNKIIKKILCYFGIVFLNILLWFPLVCKIFFKDVAKKEKEEKNVVTVLNCIKSNESINSTFLNNDPQNILYKIKGNYLINDEISDDSNSEIDTDNSNDNENELLERIIDYSEVTYDDAEDITSLKTKYTTLNESTENQNIFSNITNQEEYFKSLGFSCTTQNY